MIIPTKKLAPAAAFTDEVLVLTKRGLDRLTRNVTAFFNEFRGTDLRDLSTRPIHERLTTHKLTADDLVRGYAEKPVAHRGT
jgi:hypothetical protein